ncbi:MAG: ABC-2 family transporter protein [Clostridiales bacterium]|nr:ABC-2 family transporter protein [Clostridiales bacterium]
MNSIKLYFKYAIMNIRCKMQYKQWPFYLLGTMLTSVIEFLGVRIMFMRFGDLGDWTASHTLLVFGVANTAFGISEWIFRGFAEFPNQIRKGLFDKILLRPRTAFLQVMGERFQFEKAGRVIVGVSCIVIASDTLQIGWDITSLLVVVGAIGGGVLIYSSVMVIFASISFFTVGAISVVYIFTNHSLQYAQIPFHTMPNMIKHVLTFVFPIAICYYYPVLYIINKDINVLSFIALPVGLLFFSLSTVVWKACIKHYHSTGS